MYRIFIAVSVLALALTAPVTHGPAQRLGSVNDEQAGDVWSQPALDQVGQQRLDHGGILRRPQGHRQHVFVAGFVDADRRYYSTSRS